MENVMPQAGRHSALAVTVAVLLGVVAAMVSNTLPAFLAVLGRMRGLTEAQGGLSAMADLGGIAVGVTFCALLPGVVQKLGWRCTVAGGLALLIAANLGSIMVTDFAPYLAVRLLAGCGGGIIIAIVYAILAEGDGARALAIYNVGQLASASFAVQFFTTLSNRHGVAILFEIIAGLGVLALALTPFLPRESLREMAAEAEHAHAKESVSAAGWVAIASVFVMFVGVGSVFGFLSYMGMAWGLDPLVVEGDVSKVLLAGMTGAAVVAAIGSRFGYRTPLLLGFCLLLAAIGALLLLKPAGAFLLVGALFYFAVNVTMTYQFEAVTEVDPSSSAAMLVSAGTLGGTALGPAIAGYLVTPDYTFVNGFGLLACGASVLLILLAQRMKKAR